MLQYVKKKEIRRKNEARKEEDQSAREFSNFLEILCQDQITGPSEQVARVRNT